MQITTLSRPDRSLHGDQRPRRREATGRIHAGALAAVALLLPMFAHAAPPTAEWTRRYLGIGNGNNQVTGMVVDAVGNTYITGYSSGTWWDVATVKYSPTGVQLKQARWNAISSGDDVPYGIALDGQGNVDLDEAFDVVADAAGNAYVTGFSFQGSNDFITLKYGPDGTQQWVRRYDGPAQDQDGANAIALDADGNVLVTGLSNGSTSDLNMDAVTIKYTSAGVQQWVKRYGGPGNGGDSGIDIAADASRNIYITGYATGIGSHFDFNTIKYSTDGAEQWARDYNGPVSGYDEGQAIAVDASGNCYVTGYSDGGISMVDYDYATVKYDPAGNVAWATRYDGTGDNIDVAQEIAVLASGEVIVSGWSTGTHLTDVDFTTIKYDQGGASAVPGLSAASGLALTASPNPFRGRTTLEFALPEAGAVRLSLFAADGRRLRELASGTMEAGGHQLALPTEGLAPGVYFGELSVGGHVIRTKLVRVE